MNHLNIIVHLWIFIAYSILNFKMYDDRNLILIQDKWFRRDGSAIINILKAISR